MACRLGPGMTGSGQGLLGKVLWKKKGGAQNPEQLMPALEKLWTASTNSPPCNPPWYCVLLTPRNGSMCKFYFCIHMLRWALWFRCLQSILPLITIVIFIVITAPEL